MQQPQQTPRQSSTTSLPFAGVTKDVSARLEAEADGLVQHHVRAYEAHVFQLRREELRDPALWTRVQSSKHGSFSVYRRVRRRRRTDTSTRLPTQLLGVGFAVGTVDDMLFGASALSTAAIKIQSRYTQDPVVDAAVLATLRAPSANDPLRSVTLKWMMKKPKMYGVTRHRDYVFIESIGVCRSSVSGERIGFHLMHSVDLPSFPPLDDESDVVRRRLSCCYLYRSIGSGLLECFLRTSTDPSRRSPEPLVVRAAANRLVQCCPGFMRVAATNKLIFALQETVSRPPRRMEDPSSCNVCLKSLGLCKRGRPCQLCNQLCCSSCLVVWKTNFALTALGGGSILEKRLRFCRSCILSAQGANPLSIAASRLS